MDPALYATRLYDVDRAAKFLSMVRLSRRDKDTEFEFVIHPTCLKLLIENPLLHIMLQDHHQDISALEETRQYLLPQNLTPPRPLIKLTSTFMFVPAETDLAWQPISRNMRVALRKPEGRHEENSF